MIIDAQQQYSSGQAVTATAASTNSIDHGPLTAPSGVGSNLGRDLGVGEGLYLVVLCTVAMTDGSSDSTLAVTIETDDNSAFSSAATTATVGTFAALSPIGTTLIRRLGPGDINERYSQLKYTPANGNLTTGSFTAFLTHDIQKYQSYSDNITIS